MSITFDVPRPLSPPDPNRMDPVCFVGFVPLRPGAEVPAAVEEWLAGAGWAGRGASLRDCPVPVESWEGFQALFAPDRRLDGRAEVSGAALGASVTVPEGERVFRVVVDREAEEVLLPAGEAAPESLAALLDGALRRASARVDTVAGSRHLVLARRDPHTAGALTVLTHPSLGFPRAAGAASGYADTYLGAAVRSFFAQGGRKAYVVRMGDPLPLDAQLPERIAQLARLLFGEGSAWAGAQRLAQLERAYLPPLASGEEPREDWHGVEHLLGLPDAAFLCLPDLPELLSAPGRPEALPAPPPGPEVFTECTPAAPARRERRAGGREPPRCDPQGVRVWGRLVGHLVEFLRRAAREVHLVAAAPLTVPEGADTGGAPWREAPASAFLQAASPWLAGTGSVGLPGGIEPPDGTLAGILAASAVARGTFRSAAGTVARGIHDLSPAQEAPGDGAEEGVSRFARTPAGVVLASDVTASADPLYRRGAVSRTAALLLRAARNQGQAAAFEPLSEDTWVAVRRSLDAVLLALYEEGGLRGATAREAFSVRCDRTTMTQNDLDNGRLIAEVSFQPAAPVERIHVLLSLEQGGRVELQGGAP